MPEPIVFAGAPLDRAPLERRSPDWLAARRSDPAARSLVLSERGLWVEDGHLVLVPPNGDSVFLGLSAERPLFAQDGGDAEPGRGRPAGLREAATELPVEEAALAAYAGSLLAWHRRHRFCANCGHPTEHADGGHEPRPRDGELSEVRWFGRAEVEAAAAGSAGIRLPPPYSISRRLIDGWLEG